MDELLEGAAQDLGCVVELISALSEGFEDLPKNEEVVTILGSPMGFLLQLRGVRDIISLI